MPAGGAPAEERREDVIHPHAAEDVGEVDVAGAAHAVGGAEAVVVGALLLVGKHGVGLVDLLELHLGIGIVRDIGVDLTRLLQKRALDGPRIGIALDAQHLVVVPLIRHGGDPPRTTYAIYLINLPVCGQRTTLCPRMREITSP